MPPRRKRSPTLFLFHLLLFSLFSLSSSTTSTTSLSGACKSNPQTKLCRWMLSTFNSSSPLYSYSKFSIKQALKHALRLSKLISPRHVADGPLSDCAQLFDLNVDYLHWIMDELGSAELTRPSSVGRVEALLSGVVTNQQTCYDGMRESGGGWSEGLASVIHAPVVSGSQFYSVALGLVTHALRRTRTRTRTRTSTGHVRHNKPGFMGRVLEESNGSWEHSFKIFQVSKYAFSRTM